MKEDDYVANKSNVWEQLDNSAIDLKIEMRNRYLSPNARVLDCFCGKGRIYQAVYQGKVQFYRGVDNQKIHSLVLCTVMDNIKYLASMDISEFNVFDLDAYGSPWKQMYLILKRSSQKEIMMFITDGLVMNLKRNNHVTNLVSMTENIPKWLNIPGVNRRYTDIFATMLLDATSRYGWEIKEAVYMHNERRSVYYWYLRFMKVKQ
jgi:hypothetical protein